MADSMFDWQQYLVYAQRIDLDTATEAERRSAVSRAYYAAYWKARRRLEKNGTVVSKQDAHNQVWDAYEFVTRVDKTSFQTSGNELKRLRAWADYNSKTLTPVDAKLAVSDAAKLVQELSDLIAKEGR